MREELIRSPAIRTGTGVAPVRVMIKKAAQFQRDSVRPKSRNPKAKRNGPRARRANRGAADELEPHESRNRSRAAGRKAPVALELSGSRPSRKSTRTSANRSKPDTALIRRSEAKISSPESRARRGK
jgi:hypothetical protein